MDSVSSSIYLPAPSSTFAGDVDSLFYFIYWASVVLFFIVVGAMTWFVYRYRRRGKVGLTSGKDHNLTLEILWTAIPTVLILIVFFWGFRGYLKMRVVPRDALEIKVTGQKWFWSFDYPEGASSVNELVVPVDKPVKLLMSSQDVIHSFYVPNFRVKMDVLPNRYTVAWFEANQTGEFNLFCAEYCGKGHSEMIGLVKVVPQTEYETWLEESSNLGEGMTLEEFGKLLYTKKACNTCHTTDGSASQGPSFLGRYGTSVLMSDGSRVTMDENYIRESILSPRKKIANGFQPVMPTFQGVLRGREIDALIAFIKSLNQQRAGISEESKQ